MLGIVRGMWGDERLRRRHLEPPAAHERIKDAVHALHRRGDVVDAVYCFGENNRDFLQSFKAYDVRMLSKDAWASPKVREEFNHRWDGQWIYGCSHWWHKLKILEQATRDFDAVLYMDLDIRQIAEIPSDLEERLADGQDIRSSLGIQRNWGWGAGWRHAKKWGYPQYLVEGDSKLAAQTVTTSGFLYLRSNDTAKELLDIQHMHHFWLDHQVISFLLDRRHGGWIGEKAYCAMGYHTILYRYGLQIFPPAENETVWRV